MDATTTKNISINIEEAIITQQLTRKKKQKHFLTGAIKLGIGTGVTFGICYYMDQIETHVAYIVATAFLGGLVIGEETSFSPPDQ